MRKYKMPRTKDPTDDKYKDLLDKYLTKALNRYGSFEGSNESKLVRRVVKAETKKGDKKRVGD